MTDIKRRLHSKCINDLLVLVRKANGNKLFIKNINVS